MKRFERWGLVATLALGLLAVALALAWINRPPRLAGEDELRASLAALEDAITIQWYASEPAEFTGERRAIPRAVQRIEEICGVRVQRIEPRTDPAQAAHAARLGLTPLRLRTIERDGWSETSLWSSLRVISARHGAWTCLRLGPEEAPELAVRMAAGLRQLRQPERARIGLRLPPGGFAKLEAELAQRAELFILGQAARADVPAEIDWLLWAVSPTDGPAEAAALERHLARGGNLLLLATGGATPSSADALLFSTCGAELSADSSGNPARSTANSQDFQPLGMQPNGTLYFGTAVRLAPRSSQVSAHRWHALASDAEANVRLALVQPAEREPGGTAVLCASTAPFSDAHWSDPLLAHKALLRALELQGTDPSRARLSRLSAARVDNPIELSSAQRTWLRILTVLLLPLALAIAGLFVLRRTTGRTRLGSLSLLLFLGLALLAALPRPGASTHPALAARRDRLVQAAPLELDWHVSERERLPAAWRASLDDFERELHAFSASADPVGSGVRLRIERHPAIDAQQRARLESAGIPSAWVSESDGDREAAREIVATLELRSGSRREQLHFHSATELSGARFRLGFALERLVRGASAAGSSVRIALQTPLTRLSPAEAQLQYLDRGLFAPGGNDPYLQARAFLTAQGFELLRIPEQELSGDFRADLLVILQPRRPSGAEQAAFARALERGIPGIIGAQHFMAQSRTRGSDPRQGGWWPQPQFLDLDQGFFAELGLRWRRELLFDQQCARAETWSVLDTGSTRSTERMQLSNAWFPRVAGDGLAPARLISVGALSMPQAAELELDAARASAGGYLVTPLVQSSQRTWTADWQGGELDPGLLGEQPDSKIRGARSLGLRFEAKPGIDKAGFLALGCARSFEDGELFRAETDNANALLEWCARATLPADLCELLADRARGAGLVHVLPQERVRLRVLVLAGPLVLLLAAFLAWRRWRA